MQIPWNEGVFDGARWRGAVPTARRRSRREQPLVGAVGLRSACSCSGVGAWVWARVCGQLRVVVSRWRAVFRVAGIAGAWASGSGFLGCRGSVRLVGLGQGAGRGVVALVSGTAWRETCAGPASGRLFPRTVSCRCPPPRCRGRPADRQASAIRRCRICGRVSVPQNSSPSMTKLGTPNTPRASARRPIVRSSSAPCSSRRA